MAAKRKKPRPRRPVRRRREPPPEPVASEGTPAAAEEAPAEAVDPGPPFHVEVVWGDVTKEQADVYIVGHYQGVLPQNAEAAFDKAVSASDDEQRRLITSLTRSGVLRGALGDVFFVPWGEASVAIAGMGRPGTFRQPQLRVLWRSVTQTLGSLSAEPAVCTVLIGSGAGTLSVEDAVVGLVEGVREALAGDPALKLTRLTIVERGLDRAVETLTTLKERADAAQGRGGTDAWPALKIEPELKEGKEGTIPDPFCYSVLSAAIAQAHGRVDKTVLREALRPILGEIADEKLRERVADGLKDLSPKRAGGAIDLRQLALNYRLREPKPDDDGSIATRIAFSVQQNAIHSSAITHTVTVAERTLGIKPSLIQRAVEQMVDPDAEQLQQYGRALSRFLIHPDFQRIVEQDGWHLVLEVDRQMAAVPWEMLHWGPATDPLSIRRPVARQLRASYTMPRLQELTARTRLRALVIGDPAEPPRSLEQSRKEARAVAEILSAHGFDVELRIGAPEDGTGAGPVPGVRAADFLEVVDLLTTGDFDLVHYSGHADSPPDHPEHSGWLFKKNEFLTPGDLEALERPPSIVVANACSTGQLGPTELVRSLADEFFRRGVYDYIGTAWPVKEEPAIAFAGAFYEALFPSPGAGEKPPTIGDAVLTARKALRARKEFGNVWGAYQHYGDPTRQAQARPPQT